MLARPLLLQTRYIQHHVGTRHDDMAACLTDRKRRRGQRHGHRRPGLLHAIGWWIVPNPLQTSGWQHRPRSACHLKLNIFRRKRVKPYGYTVFPTALKFVVWRGGVHLNYCCDITNDRRANTDSIWPKIDGPMQFFDFDHVIDRDG